MELFDDDGITPMEASNLPLYQRVRNALRERISSGQLGVGDWLPSEAELQREFGVSQTPVRRALHELEQAGFIDRYQGRGSVVRAKELAAVHGMIGLGAELRNRGHDVTSRTLSITTQPVPAEAARKLHVPAGTQVPYVRRVFDVDGIPSVLFDHYLTPAVQLASLPAGHLPSLYGFLASQGMAPTSALESITAAVLDPEQAAILSTNPGAAALVRTRVAFTHDNTPVEATTYLIRADRYAMHIEMRDTWR